MKLNPEIDYYYFRIFVYICSIKLKYLRIMEKNKIILKVTCIVCSKVYELPVYEEDYKKYMDRKCNCQDAFPYLTPGQRELLISGMCDSCFDNLFAEEEE